MAFKDIFFRFQEPRDQQKELIADLYEAIKQKKHVIAHAPTGLGKTDSAISAALTYALENNKSVFFLTPKISQHEIAVEVLKGLRKKFKLNFRAVDFVGRRYMCIDPILGNSDFSGFYEICSKKRIKETCPYYGNAVGFSKQQKEKARFNLKEIKKDVKGAVSHLELKAFSEAYKDAEGSHPLCPYELATLLAKDSEIIIGDYFHVMNHSIKDIVFKRMNKKLEDSILIIDEAHNLPERIRRMLSTTVSTFQLRKAEEELRKLGELDGAKQLHKIEKAIKGLAKIYLSHSQKEVLLPKEKFSKPANAIVGDLEEFAAYLKEKGFEYVEAANGKSSLMLIYKFFSVWEENLKDSIRFIRLHPNKADVSLQVKNLDPSAITGGIFKECHSAILMSGTLTPQEMYRDLLGMEKERTLLKEYLSPFPKDNRLNMIVPNVTTKYSSRTDAEFMLIAQNISKMVNSVPGNSAIFFPSFKILNSVYPHLIDLVPRKILRQKERMPSGDLRQLLSSFRNAGLSFGSVLLAVAGGSISEGVDFIGEQLKCVVVVGVPLQEMNLELKCLIDYYDEKYKRGWHYAYIFPAMNKALQAAGRCIRDVADEGVVAFMDKRYLWDNYYKCFPKDFTKIVSNEPEKHVRNFFLED